ncbi:MAG: TonB-dependent receptor [Sphingomonas sp.]|uniref:TonB-dependent receptor n=1 Tax=Sphingomonas sp. TaxID=28214 RepID=UPI0035687886
MSRSTVAKSSLLFGAAISALLCSTGAFAQEAAAPAAQESTDAGLNDIVVTAERRPETVLKSPLSVTALTGDSLRSFQTGGDDILSLSGRVPGLYAETTTGRIFPRFYIRGLGNIDFYLGASQPVSIIQDDVVLEHVVLKSNPVFDVAQTEVLRGPQGSLFGRNTTAGIIKFDTIKPTQQFEGRGQFSYGSYNTITADAGVGGPIVQDLLAFRVSALYQHRDNWVDNTFTGVSADGTVSPQKDAMGGFDERDVRLQLLFTPGDRFSVNISAHARDYDGTSTLFHRAALKKGSNSVDAEPRDKVAFDEAMNNPQAYTTYGESVRAAYDFGGVVLTSISAYETTQGYSRGDTDGGAAANFGGTGFGESQGNVRSLDQLTQEVRLASDGDNPFKWQVGGMYFDQRDITDFYQRAYFLTTAARNPNNWVRLHDVNTSWAAFGQVSYKILPGLTLTAGGRVTEDKKTTQLLKTANTAANAVTYTGRRFVELKDTQPSWDFSALYEASSDLSLYARVARGFRGPTIQGRSAVFNSDFTTANSETILSWEAGFKSRLFNNMLSLNATAFTYTVDDIQLNGNDSNGNGVLFNADKAKAYGLEAEAEFRPTSNLSLGLGLSLLHSEIKDKRVYAQVCALNGVVVCTVQNPTITVPVFGSPAVFAQIDGQPLPNAPEYTVNFNGRYDVPLGNGGKVFLATDWNLQGYTNFVLYKTKEFYSDGTFEGGLKVGYTAPGGAYEVALFGRNITNEKNLKGVIENYMAAVFNEPRVIGISVSGKFR